MKRREFIGAAIAAAVVGPAHAIELEKVKVGISADPKDPRYTPLAAKCQVYVDGFAIEHCTMADERTGEYKAVIPDHSLSLIYMERMPPPTSRKGLVEIRGLTHAERESLRG